RRVGRGPAGRATSATHWCSRSAFPRAGQLQRNVPAFRRSGVCRSRDDLIRRFVQVGRVAVSRGPRHVPSVVCVWRSSHALARVERRHGRYPASARQRPVTLREGVDLATVSALSRSCRTSDASCACEGGRKKSLAKKVAARGWTEGSKGWLVIARTAATPQPALPR